MLGKQTDNFTSNPDAADPTTLLNFHEAPDEVVTVKGMTKLNK